MVPHASYRRPLTLVSGVWLVNAALILAFVLVPSLHFELPAAVHTNLHTLFETVSIIVSMLVFSAGWFTFSREGRSNVALLCSIFFGVAILDFVHLLSYEGMPAFIIPATDGKSISFFLAARLLVAGALLAIAFQPWNRRIGNQERHWLLGGSLVFALGVSVYGLLEPDVRTWFFVPGSGLTGTKIAVEYLVIVLNLAAAAGFYLRMREPQPYPLVPLFAAACLMALSELCFTLYATFEDQYMVLGHVIKVEAYLFVFRAIFIEFLEGPYRQLEGARADLVESGEKYRLLFENAPDAYLMANADGSFHTANPAASALFGIPRQDLWRIGRSDVTSDPRLAGFLEERSRTGSARGELTLRRGDGSTFLAEVSSSTYTDSRGRPMSSTFVHDITAKRQGEEEILSLNATLEQRVHDRTAELQSAYEDLERLSQVMAHDLRSPLLAIEGFAGLLMRDASQLLDERQKGHLDRIHAAAIRMAEMIDALLQFADVSRSTLKMQTLDIAAMADKALWSCQKRDPQRVVKAVVQRPVMLEGDARMITLVMETLIGTAWKNTARNKNAEIGVGAESGPAGEMVCFVSYNGTETNPAAVDQALEAFPSLRTARESAHSDIVLDNMRLVIARHGGRVWRESTSGRGTIYRFTLDQVAH
ncbi:MAG: MASE3 domain-containing protein [Polaromonas sp.]|uniref:MASE3 domain-containing protein n=1 Tax=Polaromonas sp. TaxID=1869339 RepID=UPI002486F51E|nr:MASE3 domain-containing protein [Polaromonas sp.]MDI1239127.1 MASE3 domain-containing protein [Polaromonas sp.]